MQENVFKTQKGDLHWQRSDPWNPRADTLVFLHGLTADHTMFRDQVACFDGEYDVVTWDAPGHGRSRPFAAFGFREAAGYLRDILSSCGAEKAVLIGQSLGGYFAQSLIREAPDLVDGFVSIGSTPYGTGYYSKTDVWILKQVEWMARLYPFGWMKRAMAKQVSATRKAYGNMLEMLAPYGKRELCRLMGIGYAGFLAENADTEIPCPVQLILGEGDRTGKVRQYNEAWAKKTGYPLEIIRGAAHNANVDRPDAVNACIRRFLGSISR